MKKIHLSKNAQRERLLARIDEPHKNCKFGLADSRGTISGYLPLFATDPH